MEKKKTNHDTLLRRPSRPAPGSGRGAGAELLRTQPWDDVSAPSSPFCTPWRLGDPPPAPPNIVQCGSCTGTPHPQHWERRPRIVTPGGGWGCVCECVCGVGALGCAVPPPRSWLLSVTKAGRGRCRSPPTLLLVVVVPLYFILFCFVFFFL